MSYLLAFLGFAALIVLHEAGHFAAAKAVGMRVERFSLFFGPMLWSVRRGETEYGVGPIPLGGYVKISGMNPHEEIPPEVVPRAYYNQPVWKRIFVILAGPAVIARVFEPQERKQLSGIVGGYTVTQESFATSATLALWVLALISLSLAVINLFPFLPLDGGHVFWALAEKVRGRRIPFEVMERAGAVGFVLIVLVFVIGLSNDISTLTGSGFNVR